MKSVLATKKDMLEMTNKKTGKKQIFLKKSFWRKVATAFNLVDEIISEEKIEEKAGHYKYKFVVRAIAPNGRSSVGVGMCSTSEKDYAAKEHDIYSTAHTRAKNRAISDLVGGGEVSAEEIDMRSEKNDSKKSK
jgi:hypothetical protein